jgi:hypothetical protein
VNLSVRAADREDVYKDIARVPERYRQNLRGCTIKEGSVCKVSVGSKHSFVLLRGLQDSQEAVIRLDERKRNELGLNPGDAADFSFSEVGLWGSLCWAWRASDPAYRVSARLGVLSLALGLIGLFLGIVSLCR